MGQFFILLSRVQQEYNGLLVNALTEYLQMAAYKSGELSWVRNIIPRYRKRL